MNNNNNNRFGITMIKRFIFFIRILRYINKYMYIGGIIRIFYFPLAYVINNWRKSFYTNDPF